MARRDIDSGGAPGFPPGGPGGSRDGRADGRRNSHLGIYTVFVQDDDWRRNAIAVYPRDGPGRTWDGPRAKTSVGEKSVQHERNRCTHRV